MTTLDIVFTTVDSVKEFVNALVAFDCDFDMISGRYVVDAKSIMGIYSLDLSKPISLAIHTDEEEEIAKIKAAIKNYLI